MNQSKQSRRVCASAHTSPLAATGAFPFVSHTAWVACGLSYFFFCDHAPALPYPSADPEKYTPLYGCYCAYAMSKGGLAPADPLSFLMIDGKLHLFFKGKMMLMVPINTRFRWEKDPIGNKKRAEANWANKTYKGMPPGMIQGKKRP